MQQSGLYLFCAMHLCSAGDTGWGEGGVGGSQADPFLAELAFHCWELTLQQQFYKDLGERSSKREMASREHSIFRGKKIKLSIVETRTLLNFNTEKRSQRELKLGIILPRTIEGPCLVVPWACVLRQRPCNLFQP